MMLAEDVIVQKLRWGSSNGMDKTTDIPAVQGIERLEMHYIDNWCAIHKTTDRLAVALARFPDL